MSWGKQKEFACNSWLEKAFAQVLRILEEVEHYNLAQTISKLKSYPDL